MASGASIREEPFSSFSDRELVPIVVSRIGLPLPRS
jgi:hypothetical protein